VKDEHRLPKILETETFAEIAQLKQGHEELTRKISGKNSHIYRVEKLNKEFEAELEGYKLKITQLQKDLN